MSATRGRIKIDVNDIVGKRLGKLEVIGYAGLRYYSTNNKCKYRATHYYTARCECGEEKVVRRAQILNEIVHSCGCLRKKKGVK